MLTLTPSTLVAVARAGAVRRDVFFALVLVVVVALVVVVVPTFGLPDAETCTAGA